MRKGTSLVAAAAVAAGLGSLAYPLLAFLLIPEHGWTRLISRNRIATPGAPLSVRLLTCWSWSPAG
jgi:hypothetical protein